MAAENQDRSLGLVHRGGVEEAEAFEVYEHDMLFDPSLHQADRALHVPHEKSHMRVDVGCILHDVVKDDNCWGDGRTRLSI